MTQVDGLQRRILRVAAYFIYLGQVWLQIDQGHTVVLYVVGSHMTRTFTIAAGYYFEYYQILNIKNANNSFLHTMTSK
jgi:hypothetical protein